MTADEIASLIEGAAARHGVPTDALMAIANLESSGNINADNPRSSASGLFQFVDSTAREYGLTGNRRNDPAAQADAAAKMMATNARSLGQSLGREPNAGELYLAHQQGLTGARALLTNPNRPAIDVLTSVYGSRQKAQNALRLNGGRADQSAGQFAGQWINKANQRAALIPPGAIPNVVASRLDTTPPTRNVPRPQPRPDQRMIQGVSERPTSAASRAIPVMDATPRLAPAQDGIFAYTPPDMQTAQIAPGRGSLTPDFFRPQVRLPELPPPNIGTTRDVPMPRLDPRLPNRMDRAADAIPSNVMRQELALQGQSYAARDGAPPRSGVGQPPATRVVQSVPPPMPVPPRPTGPSLSRDSVAQARMGNEAVQRLGPTAFAPPSPPLPASAMPNMVPGPREVIKTAEALPAGVFPQMPQVGTRLDVAPIPPLPVGPAFPPMPRPRPMRTANVQMPTPVAMRPMPQFQPQAPSMRPPLRIVVDGAGVIRPPLRAPAHGNTYVSDTAASSSSNRGYGG